MAEHEPTIGGSDEWYTPRSMFAAMGVAFDLDPCSPGAGHWVPATSVYTAADDGLSRPWLGFVFMNPPYGGRHGHIPWLRKFLAHGNGVAVVRAYTSADWFHEYAPLADAWLFPRGKTKFVPAPALEAKLAAKASDGVFRNAPGHGVVLLASGSRGVTALQRAALARYGLFIDRRSA